MAKDRKKNAVFFDLDGTWLREPLTDHWFTAAARAGFVPYETMKELRRLTDLYQKRKIGYEEVVAFQIQSVMRGDHLVGMGVHQVDRIAFGVVEEHGRRVHDFTERLSNAAIGCTALRVVISGSLHNVANEFAKTRGIEVVYATKYPSKDGCFIKGPYEEWVTRKDKAVVEIALKYDLDMDRSIAIGDTVSDAAMMKLVGHPICFNPTKELLDIARKPEHLWTCVWEKKRHAVVLRPDRFGELCEASLADILPANIMHHFTKTK